MQTLVFRGHHYQSLQISLITIEEDLFIKIQTETLEIDPLI